jgi:hypothetical protein
MIKETNQPTAKLLPGARVNGYFSQGRLGSCFAKISKFSLPFLVQAKLL